MCYLGGQIRNIRNRNLEIYSEIYKQHRENVLNYPPIKYNFETKYSKLTTKYFEVIIERFAAVNDNALRLAKA